MNAFQRRGDAVHKALAAVAFWHDVLLVIISRREEESTKRVRSRLQVRANKVHGCEVSESNETHRGARLWKVDREGVFFVPALAGHATGT